MLLASQKKRKTNCLAVTSKLDKRSLGLKTWCALQLRIIIIRIIAKVFRTYRGLSFDVYRGSWMPCGRCDEKKRTIRLFMGMSQCHRRHAVPLRRFVTFVWSCLLLRKHSSLSFQPVKKGEVAIISKNQ